MGGLGRLVVCLAVAGCSVDPLELEGRECPCIRGWVCDEQRNRCVPDGAEDAATDAPERRDAIVDTDAARDASDALDGGRVDGSREDAGGGDGGDPPMDGGPVDSGGADSGVDAGRDAGVDAGFDAGRDAGADAGFDAGLDTGLPSDSGTGACVKWSTVNRGSAVQIVAPGFDATSGPGGIAVATHGLTSATMQRAYLEIHVINADNNAEIGVKDGNFSSLGDYHGEVPGSSAYYDNFTGRLHTRGSGWSVQVPAGQAEFDDGDVIMWALDRATGELWYGRNGVWVASGNPATPASPTFRAPSTANWYPSGYVVGSARFRIVTATPGFSYAIPAGFVSFALAVGASDGPECAP